MRFWRVPLDAQEVQIPRGEIHLIIDRCKGCAFCVEFCPRGVLTMSEDYNAKGYHYPVVAEPGQCVDCDLCQVICPDFAIFCEPVEAREGRAKPAASADPDPPTATSEERDQGPALSLVEREVRHGTG